MTDWFEQSEFRSGDSELSPSEHFESAHSPTLSYTFIRKSLASLDAGLDEFGDDERQEAEIYANVIVFREAMQYIEEFGIYLYSRLDPDVEFVEAITGTMPRQVKQIFESVRGEELDDVINEYHGDIDPDEWLKEQFGYLTAEQQQNEVTLDDLVDDDSEVVVESVGEAISVSLETIRVHLQQIAEFFLRFQDPYNAVKHGNRVTPYSKHGFTIDGPFGEKAIEIDEELVSFLCKSSGDRHGGQLYTFTVPVRILREQSVVIVNLANNLYTHVYGLRQKVEESRRTGEKVEITLQFYGIVASSDDDYQVDLTSIQSPDASIWLPEEVFPDEYQERELAFQTELAVGLHRRGNDMVIETESDQTRSYEYPLLIEAEMSSDENRLTGMRMNQGFSFNLHVFPLWQFLEIQSLNEIDPIESVTLEHVGLEESRSLPTDGPVSLPDLPESEFPGILEYLRNVGRAADSEIWFPYYWPPRVLQVVDFYQREFDLTRDVAGELLHDIDEFTADNVATIPSVGILDPAETDEDGNLQVLRSEELRLQWGGLIFEVDEGTGVGNFEYVLGSDSRYERDDAGEAEVMIASFIEESPDQAFELFLESGIDAISDLSILLDNEQANAVLEIRRSFGPKLTWYYVDRLNFLLYSDLPAHIEEELS